jgi:hypothetical protein
LRAVESRENDIQAPAILVAMNCDVIRISKI